MKAVPLKLVKAVDELGKLKARIADLQVKEEALEMELRKSGRKVIDGKKFRASVSRFERWILNREAVIKKNGAKWVKRNSYPTPIVQVRCKARKTSK